MTNRHMALAGAFAAVLGLSGAAFAQSTSPSATTPNLGPAGQPVTQQDQRRGGAVEGERAQTSNPTPMAPGSRAGQAPGMGGAAPATGTTTPTAPSQGAGRPAAQSGARSDTAPLSGANSFTEGQAQSRIVDAGYAELQGLRLDEQGVWRGRAMRNGRPTGVALDYQGNIVATD